MFWIAELPLRCIEAKENKGLPSFLTWSPKKLTVEKPSRGICHISQILGQTCFFKNIFYF